MFHRTVVRVQAHGAEAGATIVVVEIQTSLMSPATRSAWASVVDDRDDTRGPNGGRATTRLPQPVVKIS